MIEAFGVPVLNSDGVPHNNKWSKIWGRITKLRGENLLTTRRLYCKTAHFIYQIEVNAFGLRVKSSKVFISFQQHKLFRGIQTRLSVCSEPQAEV